MSSAIARLGVLLALVHIDACYALPRERPARAITISSDVPVTTSYSSAAAVSSTETASVTVSPSVSTTVNTQLPTGAATQNPVNTPTVPISSGSLSAISSTLAPASTTPSEGEVSDIFATPIAFDALPAQILTGSQHPMPTSAVADGKRGYPIETNKFYDNWLLANQTSAIWTQPYSLAWDKTKSRGIAVTHIERSNLTWSGNTGEGPEYFIAPLGVQDIVISAAELDATTALTMDSITGFSAYANLETASGGTTVSFPLCQGMGFVTAVFGGAQPMLTSGTQFLTLTNAGAVNGGATYKWQVVLNDTTSWLIYITPHGGTGNPPLTLTNTSTITGPEAFTGLVQIAKDPTNFAANAAYDTAAGIYAVNATLSGSVNGTTGTYALAWNTLGYSNQTLLMFALPHLVASFDGATSSALTNIKLTTITKGMAQAVLANRMTMVEDNLPTSIGFAPWVPAGGGAQTGTTNDQLSAAAMSAVNDAGATELDEDIPKQTSLNSMYYSGKALAKFAGIIYSVQELGKNSNLAAAGLIKLKDAFNVFVNNTQQYPLIWDSTWKGVISSASYTGGDSGLDFGNTYYNDHQFHYGYFVWAAAIIGYLDPTWLDDGTNRAWVNMLVRDYANPSSDDTYFPFQRSFDWYHGHSWAKGLFDSGDGKDEESSSEDAFATYALKMWGRVTGDANMEARGNLQLAVHARSLRSYFLLASDNAVQPAQFVPNKVTGVLFENKVQHTTYFGSKAEYVEGIHMIPLNPSSAYTRPRAFVQEEWDTYFSNGRVDATDNTGWRNVLYGNLALIDPVASYNYFASSAFDVSTLDGGASRTWYLALAAGLGGSS